MTGRPRSFDPQEVLNRAMEAFWARGYENTGLPDLERATGLGRQSLYNAFGDKRALFARAVEHYFEQVLKRLIIDVLDAPGSARENIERVLDLWEAAALAEDFNGCLLGNTAADLHDKKDPIADIVRRKLRLLEDAFHRTLKRAQQAGELSPSLDPRATARLLVATSQGLAVIARVNRERAFIQSVVGSARRLIR